MLLDDIILNKEEILKIFRIYEAEDVLIFGSVSQRKERDDSDIDFLATLKKDENTGAIDIVKFNALVQELKKYFNRPIHLSDYSEVAIGEKYSDAISKGFKLT
ncbi:hypothetical protein GCM10008014_09060 [Paenibacillus silvae]|uniref:Polymerase beta nucleotidyltransferase domain-containing protein n=1 Tax=Paenibacillus silvae TaxID=1325358 RepID=A0ABQ1Z452_9BACL|nr:nucleotidyltransferase domain-containing protein [Paenibacillus silvae]GGH46407.1 hypothetical protein GCM10008014_09060 [Paenibacillus silvae]